MSSSDYQAHASRMNVKAATIHREWVESLSSEQRANLKRLGVFDAPDDSHEVGGHSPMQTADVAESPLARVEPDYAGLIDGEVGEIADRFGITLPLAAQLLAWHTAAVTAALRTHEADLLSVVVGGLLASKNVRIACGGLAFASGMVAANALGSQAEYARSIGVSRTIISKSVKGWQRSLNLRPSNFQKSEEACATYAACATKNHWRKQKVSATALAERLKSQRAGRSSPSPTSK